MPAAGCSFFEIKCVTICNFCFNAIVECGRGIELRPVQPNPLFSCCLNKGETEGGEPVYFSLLSSGHQISVIP
jgi:hypothetical protein